MKNKMNFIQYLIDNQYYNYCNRLLFLFSLLMISSSVFGQEGTYIEGKVTAKGEPMIGVTVAINGSSGGVTDINGFYRFEVLEGQSTVVFSYLGYETEEREIFFNAMETVTLDIELVEKVTLLNTATVTSGKYEKPLGEVTVSLEILKPELIANANATTLDIGLEKVPGVNIIDGQPNIRSGSGYSFGAGSRVLLLVNDIPALQADAGFPNWNDVSLENIEQIEIVKGAASALYGSSALNGIINIRTAYAKSTPVTTVSTFGTKYMTPKDEQKKWWGDTLRYDAGISLAHRQKFGKLDVVLGASYLKENGANKAIYVDYYRFNTNLRYRITDKLTIGVHGSLTTGESGNMFFWANDSTGAYLPSVGSDFASEITRYTIDPFVTYFDKNDNRHRFLGRWYSVNNNNSNGNAIYSDLAYGEYQFQRKFDNNLVLTSGLVGMYSASEGPLYGDTAYTTTNTAIYIQVDKKLFDKLNLSFGGRYEVNTISNPTLVVPILDTIPAADEREAKPVFRFGANYQAAEFTYFRASVGQGYRFPTVAEKFISTRIGAGAFTVPILQNPELRSETGWSAEIGLKQGFKVSKWNGFVDVSAFWMEYSNMMEFTFGGNDPTAPIFGFQSLNVGDTRITGMELTVAGQGNLGNIPTNILAGYTYSNPVFQEFTAEDSLLSSADYNVLKYRFRHTAKFDIESSYQGFSIGVAMLYTSYMEAIDNVFNAVIPGVQKYREENNKGALVTNVRISYQINDTFKAAIIANNLLNTEYMLRPGLLEAPRNIGLRLDAKF